MSKIREVLSDEQLETAISVTKIMMKYNVNTLHDLHNYLLQSYLRASHARQGLAEYDEWFEDNIIKKRHRL